jgi:hypothetical protein
MRIPGAIDLPSTALVAAVDPEDLGGAPYERKSSAIIRSGT